MPIWSPGDPLEGLLRQAGWPEEAIPYAVTVSFCESSWQPWAYNPSGAYGLFQLMPFHDWRYFGADKTDPLAQARAALHLFLEQGWTPWVCA